MTIEFWNDVGKGSDNWSLYVDCQYLSLLKIFLFCFSFFCIFVGLIKTEKNSKIRGYGV